VIVIVLALILIGLVAVCAVALVALDERWQTRVEQERIGREVRRAEHQIHNVAGSAFAQMMEVARHHPSEPDPE
jgi:hypothetical protein